LIPQQWQFWNNTVFWQDYKNAHDIVWETGDTLPYWAQLITTAELLVHAARRNITPLAATTADIEWDGAPISFH
jgi:hypothetical protein